MKFDFYSVDWYRETSSISNPKSHTTVFIRNSKYYTSKLKDYALDFICPIDFYKPSQSFSVFHRFYPVVDPEYIFTLFHNWLYRSPLKNEISDCARVDSLAIVGTEGAHVAYPSDDFTKKVQMIHVGNVVVKAGAVIMASAVIERGVFNSTVIGENSIIDCQTLIGHEAQIGKGCIIAAGAVVGGSVKMGDNVSVGLNATIRNGVSICDNVVIGMGSVVVRDITMPGVYYGNPACFRKQFINCNLG